MTQMQLYSRVGQIKTTQKCEHYTLKLSNTGKINMNTKENTKTRGKGKTKSREQNPYLSLKIDGMVTSC